MLPNYFQIENLLFLESGENGGLLHPKEYCRLGFDHWYRNKLQIKLLKLNTVPFPV